MIKSLRDSAEEEDCGPFQVEFEQILARLNDLPVHKRGGAALNLSSLLCEYAAFETAGTVSSALSGELVTASAEVSKLATRVTDSPFADQSPRRVI